MTIDHDDPAVYLNEEPSDAGRMLTGQIKQGHDGAHTPLWMFTELAVRQRRDSAWIAARNAAERKIRRWVLAGLGTLAANLVLVLGATAHRLEETGRAEERAANQERSAQERRDAMEREIQDLRLDVRELRAALRRMSGSDQPAGDNGEGDTMVDPDKFARALRATPLEIFASAMAAVLPKPRPGPDSSCGASCSSNIECNSGLIKSCPFCNFGTCKSTRPESPIVDAGVDAPPATTSP